MKKILLDECIPRKFKSHLVGHECFTVPEAGWAGKKNGELLSLAEKGEFEVFITLDQGIEFEQNLSGRRSAHALLGKNFPNGAGDLENLPAFTINDPELAELEKLFNVSDSPDNTK